MCHKRLFRLRRQAIRAVNSQRGAWLVAAQPPSSLEPPLSLVLDASEASVLSDPSLESDGSLLSDASLESLGSLASEESPASGFWPSSVMASMHQVAPPSTGVDTKELELMVTSANTAFASVAVIVPLAVSQDEISTPPSDA